MARVGRRTLFLFSFVALALCFMLLDHLRPEIDATNGSGTTATTTTKKPKRSKKRLQIPDVPLYPDAPKVAHAVTLTLCNKFGKIGGAIEPLQILRHNIHRNSIHHNESISRYSYQMIAFIYKDGKDCPELAPLLERMGYKTKLVDVPLNVDDIPNEYYRTTVKGNGCCGEKEFIKLYAVGLTDYPIVVHWDLDTLPLKSMDNAFDVILYDKDSAEGQAARQRLEIERPKIQAWPNASIDMMFTTENKNWLEHSPVNGGFLVLRTSQELFDDQIRVIMRGNYTKEKGWGDMGYGGEPEGQGKYYYPGGMTIQGFMGYYYEQIHPGHKLELDNCRWNQASKRLVRVNKNGGGRDGMCQKPPPPGVSWEENRPEHGMCEDCINVPVDEMRTIHYQMGRKPWLCRMDYGKEDTFNSMVPYLTEYYRVRRDLEKRIAETLGTKPQEYNGPYEPDIFLGFCQEEGKVIGMPELPEDFDMKYLYGF